MKILLSVLALILSLQSWTKADDISDFQIEGISIGDSQLDFLNKLAFKLYSDKNKFRKTFIVATIVGLTLGVFLGYYME